MSSRRVRLRPEPFFRELKRAYKTDKKVLIYVVLTFLLLTLLTLSSFNFFKDSDLLGGGRCKLADVPQSNEMQTYFYDLVMRHRPSDGKSKYVAMITISEGNEPMSVITNTCTSRRFLAALIPQLDKLGVKVIAVDQSFTKGSCPDDATYKDPDTNEEVNINDHLRQAFEGANHPIIVGWGTHKRKSDTDDDDCLMLNDQFEFNPEKKPHVPTFSPENVFHGLIRLNNNDLKIPLKWWVFPYKVKPPDRTDVAEEQNSFSFETATHAPYSHVASDRVLAQDIKNYEHPYGSFVNSIPKWSAMDVLCNGLDKVARKSAYWGGDKVCDPVAHQPFDELDGKVVVVGSEIASDSKPFLDGQRSGAELHADYIEALLRGHYVTTAPEWLDNGVVILFVVLMLFLQFLAVRKLPAYKGLGDDTALWTTCGIFLTLVLVGFALLKWANLFFPVFFLSCFPIFVSLVALTLYQIQTILTKKHLPMHEGAKK